MDEIELFHYRKASGTLHFYNTGFKLLSLIFLTVGIFNSAVPGLLLMTLLTVVIFLTEYYQTQILSPSGLLKSIKGFLIFLFLIITTSGLTHSGATFRFLPFLSIEGLFSGTVYSWKLLLLIILGQLFTTTTNPQSIYGALYRILQPLPFINAGNTATMVSMTFIFIPLIFDQYLEVKNAVESRLGSHNKNPVKKIIALTLPLLQTTLMRSDEITQAMESRCYCDNPTLEDYTISKTDVILLVTSALIPFIILLLNS